MGMLEDLTEAVNGLRNEVEALPGKIELNVEHHLSSYDNGALALPERAVRALESIADSLSRVGRL